MCLPALNSLPHHYCFMYFVCVFCFSSSFFFFFLKFLFCFCKFSILRKNALQVRELCRPDYDSAEKAKKLPPTASVSFPVPRRRGTLPHTRRIATEVERSEPSARSMSRNSSHGVDNTRETTANKRREPRAKAPSARRKLDNRPAWMTHQSNPRNIGMSSRGIADALSHKPNTSLVVFFFLIASTR